MNATPPSAENFPTKVYNSKEPMQYSPQYLTLFNFEKFPHHEHYRQWMSDKWHYSIYFSSIYLILIFTLQFLMKNRSSFKLRRALTIWNISLAIFSGVAFIRSAPELVVSVFGGGFHRSICFLENHNSATSFWGLLFAWSKVVEFGDSIFIVLRKQKLIFLHYYHHLSVCFYCWWAHGSHDPASRWFSVMNLFVHFWMYFYYTGRSLQLKLPPKLAMTITGLQLTQMVVGLGVNAHAYFVITSGGECHRPLSNIYLALGMYTSYFLLFAEFFYAAYFKKKSKGE